MTPRRSLFAAASGLLAAALAPASEIVTRSVSVNILPDGATRTRTHIEVHLTSARDVDAWSPYPIRLDEDRKIEELTGSITLPDGKTRRLKRSDLDTVGEVSDSVVASSSSYRLIRFPDAPPGSRLTLDYTVLAGPSIRPTRSGSSRRSPPPPTWLSPFAEGGRSSATTSPASRSPSR